MKLVSLFLVGLSAAAISACDVTVDIGDTDTEDDGESPTPTPTPTPGPTAATCPVDGSERGALVFVEGADVVLVRANGAREIVHTFPSVDPASVWAQMATQPGFVAITAMGYLEDTTVGAALLLDAEGQVLFSDDAVEGGATSPFLSSAGDFVFAHGYYATRLIGRDGDVIDIPDTSPMGAPDADGFFALVLQPSAYVIQYGFYDPATGVVPLQMNEYNALGVDGGLLYTTSIGNARQLVRRRGSSAQSFALPVQDESTWLQASNTRGDAIVQRTEWLEDGSQLQRSWLLGADSEQYEELGAPQGREPFGSATYLGTQLDNLGAALLVARDDARGAVHVRDGAGWRVVGPTFRDIWDISVTARGGTIVAVASDQPGYFPMDPWADAGQGPQADRIGPSAFVARIDGSVVRDIPVAATTRALSANGACVAYADGDSLFSMDVSSGALVDLGDAPGTVEVPVSVAFIER